MKHLNLKNCWSKSKGAVNGWCSIPSTTTAEMMSLNKFDSLTIDLQHGLIDYQLALNMLQSLNSNEITPMARVPWNEPGIIMKLLDAGFLGIICPMINNVEDCKKFVHTTKYVPEGYRSSGPTRAILIHGQNYHEEANDNIISLAMIETEEGLENVEKICEIDGLTGIYIGPSDLSVSLGLGVFLLICNHRFPSKVYSGYNNIYTPCLKSLVKFLNISSKVNTTEITSGAISLNKA